MTCSLYVVSKIAKNLIHFEVRYHTLSTNKNGKPKILFQTSKLHTVTPTLNFVKANDAVKMKTH